MKQLLKLCQQEKKKLCQLGSQRADAQNRVSENHKQRQAIDMMLSEYHGGNSPRVSSLLLQNSANLISSLKPLQRELYKQEELLQQEHRRMDGLWRKQLGRQRGLSWIYEQRKSEQVRAKEIQEQKQLDDLSSRYQSRG